MTVRQKKALSAIAQGLTLKEAATVANYRNLQTVWVLSRSKSGRAYLAELSEKVDSETVFSIRERLTQLKTLARVHQYSAPAIALGAVKEANRIA